MKNLNKVNKYKFVSRAVMAAFMTLSTIQTLLDAQITFGVTVEANAFAASVIASIVPIMLILFIFNLVNKKTKHVNLFMIPEIKFVVKMLLYLSILLVFTLWPVLLISVIGFYFNSILTFGTVAAFLLEKIAYSVIYSTVVVFFFYGLSDLNIKKRDKSEL